MRVLICPDKFRGTATARAAATAMAAVAHDAGWESTVVPLADGGEGTLDAMGGPTTSTNVTGPLGAPVDAPWRLSGEAAVIEMALASGLALAGGAASNDPLAATSRGTGELIAAAIDGGACSIVVGVGGSACTDGGLGAVEVLAPYAPLDGSRGYSVLVACDVRTRFVDAARLFAPQKGADPGQVEALTRRLSALAEEYSLFGTDVRDLSGSGAAGGLAGGLAALGASLQSGFALVASAVSLRETLATCNYVLTGEGMLDAQSFEGKVVGGVLAMARDLGVPCTVIAGDVDRAARVAGADVKGADVAGADVKGADIVSLAASFGLEAALHETGACLRAAARSVLASNHRA